MFFFVFWEYVFVFVVLRFFIYERFKVFNARNTPLSSSAPPRLVRQSNDLVLS